MLPDETLTEYIERCFLAQVAIEVADSRPAHSVFLMDILDAIQMADKTYGFEDEDYLFIEANRIIVNRSNQKISGLPESFQTAFFEATMKALNILFDSGMVTSPNAEKSATKFKEARLFVAA